MFSNALFLLNQLCIFFLPNQSYLFLLKLFRLIKTWVIQKIYCFLPRICFSLNNEIDNDFNIEFEISQLFTSDMKNINYFKPDIHDTFHIYLSKLLYKSNEQIEQQCQKWGFDNNSIKIFPEISSENVKEYTCSTKAIVIKHNERNTIIIAFQGTELMNLTEFTNINELFKNMIDDNRKVRIHTGYYNVLGLDKIQSWDHIDWTNVSKDSPMIIQLLNYLKEFKENDNKYKISIAGHGIGGALASLFTFALLSNGYEKLIYAVYTYGQPLVGNCTYANILNRKLGNKIHRWVNNNDIFARIPTPSNNQEILNTSEDFYFHCGLRFKINVKGYWIKNEELDRKSIFGYEDGYHVFNIKYAFRNAKNLFIQKKFFRSLIWIIVPSIINDHFPCDYATKIKDIVK